jgi:hypothetical protein
VRGGDRIEFWERHIASACGLFSSRIVLISKITLHGVFAGQVERHAKDGKSNGIWSGRLLHSRKFLAKGDVFLHFPFRASILWRQIISLIQITNVSICEIGLEIHSHPHLISIY